MLSNVPETSWWLKRKQRLEVESVCPDVLVHLREFSESVASVLLLLCFRVTPRDCVLVFKDPGEGLLSQDP